MILYTIGFSKKNLKNFVGKLKDAGVSKLIDIRLHNTSQLAGYAKKDDLQYILSLVGISYEHRVDLAPTDEILKNYKDKKITWDEYERNFKEILESRAPALRFENEQSKICLLCAEPKPNHCHRRLVAEYFRRVDPGIQILHL